MCASGSDCDGVFWPDSADRDDRYFDSGYFTDEVEASPRPGRMRRRFMDVSRNQPIRFRRPRSVRLTHGVDTDAECGRTDETAGVRWRERASRDPHSRAPSGEGHVDTIIDDQQATGGRCGGGQFHGQLEKPGGGDTGAAQVYRSLRAKGAKDLFRQRPELGIQEDFRVSYGMNGRYVYQRH